MTEPSFFLDYLEEAARASLIDEVSATPKPGLVDREDNGAHRDMDFSTFLASTAAIVPFIRQMAAIGTEWKEDASLEDLFLSIRTAGAAAEEAMFRATGGVNTHKGIIFSMGLAAAAAGYHFTCLTRRTPLSPRSMAQPGTPLCPVQPGMPPLLRLCSDDILSSCRTMCGRAMEQDFAAIRPEAPKTHGESLYLQYGCRGIRGEAADGFPAVSAIGLPAIRRILNQPARSPQAGRTLQSPQASQAAACPDGALEPACSRLCLQVHLELMAGVDDTNVLFRTDYASLHYVKEQAASVLALGGSFSEAGMAALRELNRDFIRRNISPGGCADLLSISLFFWRLEQFSI